MEDELSVGEALRRFRARNGIADDNAATWTCRLGPLVLRLPNFQWRRRAIARHDLHHILTGYPCSLGGECQMAAWEFAAGRYPHPAATLFCLPLVALGVLFSPRALWSAFRAGRRSESLYGSAVTDALLGSPLAALRAAASCRSTRNGAARDVMAFSLLVAQSFLLLLAPAALAGILLLL